ncbi:MAG: hypothetical protein AB1918_05580, partial [Pseudomonadota bacterium]
MLQDWLKQNALAAVIGTAVGTAAIGGAAVYVVVVPQAQAPVVGSADEGKAPAPAPAPEVSTAAPDRFLVHVSGNLQGGMGSLRKPPIEGTRTFTCDLTVYKERFCDSGRLHRDSGKTITLMQHAGDPTRFMAKTGFSQVT